MLPLSSSYSSSPPFTPSKTLVLEGTVYSQAFQIQIQRFFHMYCNDTGEIDTLSYRNFLNDQSPPPPSTSSSTLTNNGGCSSNKSTSAINHLSLISIDFNDESTVKCIKNIISLISRRMEEQSNKNGTTASSSLSILISSPVSYPTKDILDNNYGINTNPFRCFLQDLTNIPKIKSLELRNIRERKQSILNEDVAYTLGRVLQNVEELHLTNIHLSNQIIKSIYSGCLSLNKAVAISSLHIKCCSFLGLQVQQTGQDFQHAYESNDDTFITNFATLLRYLSPSLQHLKIQACKVTDIIMSKWIDAITNTGYPSKLRSLCIANNVCSDKTIEAIGQFMSQNDCVLESLDISEQPIRLHDNGYRIYFDMEGLLHVFEHCTALKLISLNLSGLFLPPTQIMRLFRLLLPKKEQQQALVQSGIRPEAATEAKGIPSLFLQSALVSSTLSSSLQSLDMKGCGLTVSVMNMIIDCLPKMKSLREFLFVGSIVPIYKIECSRINDDHHDHNSIQITTTSSHNNNGILYDEDIVYLKAWKQFDEEDTTLEVPSCNKNIRNDIIRRFLDALQQNTTIQDVLVFVNKFKFPQRIIRYHTDLNRCNANFVLSSPSSIIVTTNDDNYNKNEENENSLSVILPSLYPLILSRASKMIMTSCLPIRKIMMEGQAVERGDNNNNDHADDELQDDGQNDVQDDDNDNDNDDEDKEEEDNSNFLCSSSERRASVFYYLLRNKILLEKTS